ncbi:MAG: thiamine phosphate synthase [Acidobacteriaceae bacterium]
MRLRNDFPSLYPILDAGILSADPEVRRGELLRLVRWVVDAGVTILQYRNKTGSDAQILADARWIRDGAGPDPTLILNDRVDLVERAGFDGAHVGQGDMSPAEARRMLGPGRVLGVSTHNPEQLAVADQAPVDYIAIGPVFATLSKENPDPVVGLEGVRAVRRLTGRPLVAIGGIGPANAKAVIEAGADCVAVISAVFGGAVEPLESGRRVSEFLGILG